MNTMTDLQIESSYLEDGMMNVLVSPLDANDPRRYVVICEPGTRRILRVEAALSTEDGFEEVTAPTNWQVFRDVIGKDPKGPTKKGAI